MTKMRIRKQVKKMSEKEFAKDMAAKKDISEDITKNLQDFNFELYRTDHYVPWRVSRISKLVSILGGKEWFVGKRILELACAYGHTGSILQQMGATVTFAEGRREQYNEIKKKAGASPVIILDQDKPWELNQKFDLIIHWGVLYHLKNWERDLITTLKHSPLICMETEVVDLDDPYAQVESPENAGNADLSMYGQATFPSPANIERVLTANLAKFIRHDDVDLNAGYHHYDWESKNSGKFGEGQRRFWFINSNTFSDNA